MIELRRFKIKPAKYLFTFFNVRGHFLANLKKKKIKKNITLLGGWMF